MLDCTGVLPGRGWGPIGHLRHRLLGVHRFRHNPRRLCHNTHGHVCVTGATLNTNWVCFFWLDCRRLLERLALPRRIRMARF